VLTRAELAALATHIGEHLCEAHRGAVPLGRGRTVILFWNDGHSHQPVGRAALDKTRAVLEADGFHVGRVVTDPAEGYTAVIEVIPPAGVGPLDAVETCEAAVREGWAAARNLDPDNDPFARLQRGIARSVTAGLTLAGVL
jgi:hypothetical protein